MSGDLEPRHNAPLVSPVVKYGALTGFPILLLVLGHPLFALLFVAAYVVGRIGSADRG